MHVITLTDPSDRLIWREGGGNTVELFDISVGSSRRHGHGRELVERMLAAIPEKTTMVYAITRTGNLISQQFYENLGWRVVGVLRCFYKDAPGTCGQVDAIMYGIDLVNRVPQRF